MKKINYFNNEKAVSPVIGVMLMLVVTVILAAAVSGYAGGIGGSMQKAPQLSMDIAIKNSGSALSSYITFDVIGVSEPIPTSDLNIVTSWRNSTSLVVTTVMPYDGTNSNTYTGSTANTYNSPLGFGKGVTLETLTQQKTSSPYDSGQYFGNYTFVPGTSMKNSPWYQTTTNGYGLGTTAKYSYPAVASTYTDGMQAILGSTWYELRPGDIVNVKIVHTPTGKVILEKNVGVE